MDTRLLNARPGRQHPINAPKMSVPMRAPGPFPALSAPGAESKQSATKKYRSK